MCAKMEFTNDEKVDMLFTYARCMRNSNNALQCYAEMYPERRAPQVRYFAKLERKLREHGSFNKIPHRSATVTVEGGENEINVLGRILMVLPVFFV